MAPAIKDIKRQDTQQNQIETTSITYDQNSVFISFKKKLVLKVKIATLDIATLDKIAIIGHDLIINETSF